MDNLPFSNNTGNGAGARHRHRPSCKVNGEPIVSCLCPRCIAKNLAHDTKAFINTKAKLFFRFSLLSIIYWHVLGYIVAVSTLLRKDSELIFRRKKYLPGARNQWQPILHNDIKPENILLRWPSRSPSSSSENTYSDIVFADFGAAGVESQTRGLRGTYVYVAREVREAFENSTLLLHRLCLAAVDSVTDSVVLTTKSNIWDLGAVMKFLFFDFDRGREVGKSAKIRRGSQSGRMRVTSMERRWSGGSGGVWLTGLWADLVRGHFWV
ncbi:uncharacterized protein M437DRAFT_63087 [Aureobasidium melanogenum CBS 110374]|uniref:Protein kinase domain-containing protein n=1 Tax=Aureobasidium melanogenum (strain CBS 110374) TaxID=1043003 RepID=A0A074WAG8_AURM1|nr:uncharacterized protein M437DRAFT_63087 [Aureobasidium melanogenum CBS 110374]KEQ66922.1 hypothetical protein M437DRAFT_63087 [Aureobasidium melanogenum CBS 110374]